MIGSKRKKYRYKYHVKARVITINSVFCYILKKFKEKWCIIRNIKSQFKQKKEDRKDGLERDS